VRLERAQSPHERELVAYVRLNGLDSINYAREVRIVSRAAPDNTENVVVTFEKEVSEKRSVLTSNPGD
jgi:hypothetical protein